MPRRPPIVRRVPTSRRFRDATRAAMSTSTVSAVYPPAVAVDDFYYLPRSFAPLYEAIPATDDPPVWAEPRVPVAEATVAALTSAGVYLPASQEPFDVERERQEPTWGDPSYRLIPSETAQEEVDAVHLHVNVEPIRRDVDVALPLRTLRTLAAEGRIGAVAAEHVSVMGYQERGCAVWRTETGPAIAQRLSELGVDVLLLAPA